MGAWGPAAAGPAPYLEQLIAEARAQDLAEHPVWLSLGHYRAGLLGGAHKSVIDSPGFFNAPDGRTDPQAELEATLAAFFSPPAPDEEQHAQCAFIARYRWLKSTLAFDRERLPEHPCPRFEDWAAAIDARRVTLVFPTAYLNNPSSMFGHTLLRLDRAGDAEDAHLLSYAVNYGAVTGDDGGLMFAVHGLTGGYHGTYDIMPYYLMVRRYSDFENRDIWEYRLDLEQHEIERLVEHLWELRGQYADYYFFDENCSYQLLFLLEAARPSLDLADDFPLHAIPIDTIRAVEHEGLFTQVVFRPSSRTRIDHRLEQLRPAERRLVHGLADGGLAPDDATLADLEPARRAAVLELAADLVTYRLRTGEQPRDQAAPLAWRLLAARSEVTADARLDPVPRPPVRPDEGHGSARLAAGFGARDGRLFGSFELRPAYHALIDRAGGFTEGAAIDFLDLELRYYEGDDAPALEELTLVGIRSLSPGSHVSRPVSWRLEGGLDRFRAEGEGEKGALVASLAGGAGPTFAPGEGVLATLMAEAELGLGGDCFRTCFAALGPGLAVVWPVGEDWRLLADGRLQALFADEIDARFRIGLAQSYVLGRNLALQADVALEDDGGGAQTEWSASLHWYF